VAGEADQSECTEPLGGHFGADSQEMLLGTRDFVAKHETANAFQKARG
jgi:hypothetical protein